jgi:hypothetical protein
MAQTGRKFFRGCGKAGFVPGSTRSSSFRAALDPLDGILEEVRPVTRFNFSLICAL